MNHKKIAELAHVSASTVSKALSGSKEVSEETAAKIRQIAIDVGYFKEKTKRKREYTDNGGLLVAIVVPEIHGFHYSTRITCLKNYIEERGGNVAVYIYDFNREKCAKLIESIIVQGATDGIITFSTPTLATKPDIPIMCITQNPVSNYDTIFSNSYEIISDPVKYLKNLGHSEIGLVGETNTTTVFAEFQKAMGEHSLRFEEKYVYKIKNRFEAIGIEAAHKLLKSKEKPTAIITAYDEIAHSLIYELEKNGVKVPEDISVMGIHNVPSSIYTQIQLTTVDTFSEEKYKTAVDILFDKIMNETKAVKHISIEHSIIERETTKPRKDNA